MEPVARAGQGTGPVSSHHTIPPHSSCAMSSLLLRPTGLPRQLRLRGQEPASALASGGRSSPPPPVPANLPGQAQLTNNPHPTPSNSLTEAFICIWCAFIYIPLPFSREAITPQLPLPMFLREAKMLLHPTLTPTLPSQILLVALEGSASSFSPSILPQPQITEPQNVRRAGSALCLHFTDEKVKVQEV